MPDITYGVVLAYNTEQTAGQVPAGWADFFDTTKFPGKRGVWDYSEGGIFEFALLADGVAPADLYPLDLERATAKLDTIKDDLVFWASGAESQELIGSGEVAMTLIWNGRGWSAKNIDKKPVEMQWNQQIVTADYLVVPKGSPNKDAAMKFIAYTICAENNAKPSEYIPYGPTNINSQPAQDKKADLSVSNADENSAYFDDEYLVNNFDDDRRRLPGLEERADRLADRRSGARLVSDLAVAGSDQKPGRARGPAVNRWALLVLPAAAFLVVFFLAPLVDHERCGA